MDINEIRKEKSKLQENILKLINDFCDKTKVSVNDISIASYSGDG